MTQEIVFPPGFFDPPEIRSDAWPCDPDIKKAVEWFKSFIPVEEWIERRARVARRLYESTLGLSNPNGDGRFFDSKDSFGWYLFLGEAFVDHIGNYDYLFGSRVIPLFQAIGRNLDFLLQVRGIEGRVARMVGKDKSQPNGSLFELLVAASYRRAGGEVTFVNEQAGKFKTHDLDVYINGVTWAVECKRMEVGQYSERERARIGVLWNAAGKLLASLDKNTLCHVSFKVELEDIPVSYLFEKVDSWLKSSQVSLIWDDSYSSGTINSLDLQPLRNLLATDSVLGNSNRLLELLTGKYTRNANHRTILNVKHADNPRYIDDCDLAIVLNWESLSLEAIEEKARDIKKKLAEATEQLPENRPSIVHIGFEALEGDIVEALRHKKIMQTALEFDPKSKKLEYVYCHYFVPESPPDEAWAFDETTQWCAIRPEHPRPLANGFLTLPGTVNSRSGPHWKTQ